MISFNQLRKNLKKDIGNLPKQKFAILSDSSTQLMVQAIRGYGIEQNFDIEIYEPEFNQIDQEIFNRSSGLYTFQPAFTFIHFSTEHLLKKFYQTPVTTRIKFSDDIIAYIRSLVETLTGNSSTQIILSNFIEINDGVFGNFATKESGSSLYQLRKLNMLLMDLAHAYPHVFICDLLALQSNLGYANIFEAKTYITADMVFSIDFLPWFAKSIIDIIAAARGFVKKCVIVDLDNTMWGGIIGDDGMEGIQVGDLGLGKAFLEFQYWLKELKQRGILIAICSKNTESIAKEPFLDHPDMVLRMDDIAIFIANWENKVDNIRFIQSVLNIGFDSMVFLDDNPFEREMVRSAIPAIAIPDLPADPAEYLIYLRTLNLFETISFTQEDTERTLLYQLESQRTDFQRSFASEDNFLENLEMSADVESFNKFSSPRVAQLTQRSNQFNLRTVRYSEAEILSLISAGNVYTMSLSLEDKFGNHGLIGAIILKAVDESTVFIDTWIMSCRVLKRGMENFTLNCIVELAAKHGFMKILGEYIPTRKNGMVGNHYAGLGFTATSDDKWELKLSDYNPKKTFITKKEKQAVHAS